MSATSGADRGDILDRECLETKTLEGASAEDPVLTHQGVRIQLLKDVLTRFGRARLRVQGTSMIPAVWPGDVLEVVREDLALRPGDVILFERPGGLVCHRIEEVMSAGMVRTRGDNLDSADPPVPTSAVLGTIRFPATRQRYASLLFRVVSFVSTRSGAWLARAGR